MGEIATAQTNEQAVQDIIDSKDVSTFFQPLVSVSAQSIIGFEAFSRGGGGAGVCSIEPAMLFHDALPSEIKVDIDRLCREKALKQFKPIHDPHKGLLLFLNVNPDILPLVDLDNIVLPKQTSAIGIDAGNVVLECALSSPHLEKIRLFWDKLHALSFKVCLDNCSVDDAFSHALGVVRPDFVKINRTFFGDDERKDHSHRALDTLCQVAERLGVLVVAQGVENEEESLRLLSAGVHLQQGYYYTKDDSVHSGEHARSFYGKMGETCNKFKFLKRELVRRKKERFGIAFKSVTSICAKFSNMSEDRFEDACMGLVNSVDDVISMFVLDNSGEQITPRVHSRRHRSTINADKILGSRKGADHSAQDYMMYLDMGYEKYVSSPFRSPFTGHEACIISRAIFNKEGMRYVICVEMPHFG